jgi:bifunctional DNA-binding transcriptional regulator/antitoxin component of YhaV-PrlF toxin-antitoxin module
VSTAEKLAMNNFQFTINIHRDWSKRKMETTISSTGKTSIPPDIRERHGIQVGDRLIWVDEGHTIRIVPVPSDPLRALRGSGRGEELVERLLNERRRERGR